MRKVGSIAVRAPLAVALAGCNLIFPPGKQVPGDAGPADASEDAAPDLDHDGVPDAIDNCRDVANPNQHDEDLDSFGDACDNCPQVANPDQANADAASGDTLGDACGDVPTTVDCIALFAGFGDAAGFEPVRGTWTIDQDSIVQSEVDTGQALLMSTVTIPDGLVYTYAHAGALAGAPAANNIGVWGHASYAAPATYPDGYLAEAHYPQPPGDQTYASASVVTNDMPTGLGMATAVVPQHALRPADDVAVALDMRSTLGWAASVGVAGSGAGHGFAAAPITAGRIGLRTNQISARFDYVLVFTQPASGVCLPGVFP